MLQPLKRTLGAVGHLAMDLEAHPQGRVALAVEAGVAQGTQHQCVMVAAGAGRLYQEGTKIAHQLYSAYRRVDYEALPHAAGIGRQGQFIELLADGCARGDTGAANAAVADAGDKYLPLAVALVFTAIEVRQAQFPAKTLLAQPVILLQQPGVPA